MRWMIPLCAGLLVAISAACADDPKVDSKTKQFKVSGKFTEITFIDGEKAESATRIPASVLIEGRKFAFHSGGSAGFTGNGGTITTPFGFALQINVARLDGDDLLVEMSVENTQISQDGKVTSTKHASVATTRKAKLGKVLRIVLEEDPRGAPRQWLDLTVGDADE
jgi:hypothetical protein